MVLFWRLLFGHFLLPFVALLARRPKRRPKMLVMAAVWMLVMHWVDIYWLVAPAGSPGNPLPRLVDLGADKCIPCKMMAPILEELRVQYAGRFEVVFIDVWKDPPKAKEFGITVIPTQILIDPDGKELMRHEGFFAKDDILAAWRTHGYDFPAPSVPKTES